MHAGCRIDNVSVALLVTLTGIRRLLEVCEACAVQHGSKNNEIKRLTFWSLGETIRSHQVCLLFG